MLREEIAEPETVAVNPEILPENSHRMLRPPDTVLENLPSSGVSSNPYAKPPPKSDLEFDNLGNTAGFDRFVALDSLERARGRWKVKSPENYDFVYERDYTVRPEERGPFLVQVRSGEVTNVVYVDGGDASVSVPGEIAQSIPTMEEFFNVIKKKTNGNVEKVELEFDETTGSLAKAVVVPIEYDFLGQRRDLMTFEYFRDLMIYKNDKKAEEITV
jgi:hypothetical protein